MLVSTASEIIKTMKKEYTERLRARSVHPLMNKLNKAKTISYKFQISKNKKSPIITMIELDYVLKTSKTEKSRDPEGMVKELFRPNMIGSDIKKSFVHL